MQFRYTILYVDDVQAAVDFYQQAFGLSLTFIHESGDYAQLATGSTQLAFASRALMHSLGKTPGRPDATAPIFELAFETEEVSAALEQALAAGAELVQPAREQSWGQTTAYVRDANGYLIEICSPVAASRPE